MKEEIWKDIDGYDGAYQISSIGRVKSMYRIVPRKNGSQKPYPEKIITPTKKGDGYLQIKLFLNAKSKMHYVQRLVAFAFIPNPLNKPFVNHIDGNKKNNLLSNLEWVTASENTIHSFKKGLQISLKDGDHPNAKIVLNRYTGIFYGTIKEAANSIGIQAGTLNVRLRSKRLKNKIDFMFV